MVGLCAAVLFLWAVAVYVTYQDSKMTRYNVSIKPGAVNYGTHSTATMPPMIQSSYRHSTPMISGDAVRAYAHTGHATMPMASTGSSSGFRIHTTSSASVHSIGGGGSTGGGMMSSGGGGSSSRGIRYSGGGVSIPTLALASMPYKANNVYSTSVQAAPGIRKINPKDTGVDGEEGDWFDGEEDGWWYYGEVGGWRAVVDGDSRFDPILGYTVVWNGSDWVKDSEYEPTVPLGATPWILMLLLAGAYALRLRIKSRKYTNK